MILSFKELMKGILVGLCCLFMYSCSMTMARFYDLVAPVAPYEVSHIYGSSLYEIDLKSQIAEDQSAFDKLARDIMKLSKDDKVILKLHNYGGSVASTQILVNALVATEAHVVADVNGGTYSAGAVIACAADELVLHPYSYLMFHNARSSNVIDGELRYQINRMLGECIKHNILTQQQVDDLNNSSGDMEIYYPSSGHVKATPIPPDSNGRTFK